MNTKQQLLQSIQETEAQLSKLKQDLESHKSLTIQEASVGDTLEDGSIVFKKENGMALVLAPDSTEVVCPWSKEFSEVFEALKDNGFNSSQWFVPTVEQLLLAHKVVPSEFNNKWYWSSTEYNATNACFVSFIHSCQGNCRKCNSNRVRAVRCIVF